MIITKNLDRTLKIMPRKCFSVDDFSEKPSKSLEGVMVAHLLPTLQNTIPV